MARLYLGKDIASAIGMESIVVNIGRGMNTDRAAVRFATLYVRNIIRGIIDGKSRLIILLNKIVDDYFNGVTGNAWVAPDSRVYFGGEKAYWIPDWNHGPMGVCPICTEYGNRWRQGHDPKKLWEVMMDPQHLIIHVESSQMRPICWCQIMPYKEANRYGIYLDIDKVGTDVDVWPEDLWQMIFDGVFGWIAAIKEVSGMQTKRQVETEKEKQTIKTIASGLGGI